MKTAFESAVEKSFPNIGVKYWMDMISKFPPNTWVLPTNESVNDYAVFDHLFEVRLVAKKTMPIWKDGMHQGSRIAFLYNLDLKFEDISL